MDSKHVNMVLPTCDLVDGVYVMMQRMPAPLAAASPMVLSSMTTHSDGSTFSFSAATCTQ
jgi:hypothetical protein